MEDQVRDNDGSNSRRSTNADAARIRLRRVTDLHLESSEIQPSGHHSPSLAVNLVFLLDVH